MTQDQSDNPTADTPLSSPGWGEVWQLPALVAGVVMLGLGLFLVMRTPAPANDFTGALDDVARAIHVREYDQAAQLLDHIGAHLEEAQPAHRGRYHLLSGDLVSQQIQSRPFDYDTPENHARVADSYQAAREAGAEVDPLRLRRWALTLVELGQADEALALAESFGPDGRLARAEVLRALVDHQREASPKEEAAILPWLDRYQEALSHLDDPQARRAGEIWVAGVQADLQVAAGQSQRGLDGLLRQMAHFQTEGDPVDLVPLMVRLGSTYQGINEPAKARQWYRQAQDALKGDPASSWHAQVLVGLAQIALAEGDIRLALDYFSQAQTGYPGTAASFDALVGRARCEAGLGAHDQALEHYTQAMAMLSQKQPLPLNAVETLTSQIREHHQLHFDKQAFARALDYLNLLKPMHAEGELPLPWLGDLAATHQALAQQRQADAQAIVPVQVLDGPAAPEAIEARKLAFQEAAIHFGHSADCYFEFARRASATDDKAYGQSLWNAANNYDRAQMWKRAIDVYAQYVNTRGDDPLRLRAQHRLGLAYLADGQYNQAATLLAQLIEDHPHSPEAYASLVPLSRAYSRMSRQDDALRVLRHVVTDHPTITRQSEEYRLALIDLGRLLHQQGQYVQAIGYLSEALQRYGQDEQGPALRFRLADAYRQSVVELDSQLDEPMNSTSRQALQTERRDRLTKAQSLYSQVVSELEARPASMLSPLEQLFHRNAYFYRADCAYDLGQYEQAIRLYDLAAKRWDQDPSSLVALVQIVNANCQLDRLQAAQVANARARQRLKEIPDEAFDDTTIPMTRRHWEEWLRWSSQLDQLRSQARTP